LAYQVGAFVNGDCLKASGTAGGIADTGSACGGGGGGTPGGVNTDVQFNNAGSFGGDAGFTYLGNGQATLALGSIATNLKALSITGTWNAGGTTFDAPLFMNITQTAFAAASGMVDIQIQGTGTVFGIGQSGAIYLLNQGTSLPPSSPFGGGPTIAGFGTTGISLSQNGNWLALFGSGGMALVNAAQDIKLANNAHIGQAGAGKITISNDTTTLPSGLFVYGTVDTPSSPTNFERGVFDWTTTSNTLTIGTQKGGTGTARPMMMAPAQQFAAAGPALPACAAGLKGYFTVVSDATAPTYNATYASGGAVVAIVVCNGTNWVTQ
jgi:hypothetical protein